MRQNASGSNASGSNVTNEGARSGYASMNGPICTIRYTDGQPLVVLPGAFRTIEAMGEMVPQLAATRRVVAVVRLLSASSCVGTRCESGRRRGPALA